MFDLLWMTGCGKMKIVITMKKADILEMKRPSLLIWFLKNCGKEMK